MQVIKENKTSEIMIDVISFYQSFGDELDACHPEAFDSIHNLINQRPADSDGKEQVSDFIFYYGDELEGCNEEAYERFVKIMKKHNITI